MNNCRQSDEKLSQNVTTALLSVTGSSDSGGLLSIFGIPLILYNIKVFQELGVTNFFVEVEQVTEALIALSDDLRGEDLELKFVRTAAELADGGAPSEKIYVVSDGTYCQSDFHKSQILRDEAVILTLENSDTRQGFERIDLESQWSGLAIVDWDVLAKLGDLPDGWSLPSAILRQAMKAQTPTRQLTQEELEAGSLQYIADQSAADDLAKSMLTNVSRGEGGMIERQLFLPCAGWVGKQQPALFAAASQIAFGLAAIAALLCYFAPLTVVALIGFASLLFAFHDRQWAALNLQKRPYILTSGAMLLLAAVLAVAGWRSSGLDGIFAALIAAGLAVGLHRMLRVSRMSNGLDPHLIPSPGLLSLLLAVAALTSHFSAILQLFALMQIGVLLYLIQVMLSAVGKRR